MDRHKIRLGRTDSVKSVNRDNFLGVQLKSTFKKLHYNDIKTTVDQYERFALERAECENYRVILTINPYCTNVLFNPLTEIVKNEGSDDVNTERYWSNSNPVNGIDGSGTPKRIQMIANTEYSKPLTEGDNKSGYTYLPGYDIFDNHIFRDMGFNIVERPSAGNNQYGNVFNTISDYERDSAGNILTEYRRKNASSKPQKMKKHLHTSDNFLTFEDSVNANLTDENGWFGFTNVSNLRTASAEDNKLSDICCVINNRKNCEFVEMYPDSTLYSFKPKYNKFRHRLEYNWEVHITYAFENDYCNNLVKNNSLPLFKPYKSTGVAGDDIIIFRCYTKHNLKRGDTFKLFYSYPKEGESISDKTVCRVANVGNASGGDNEYYFYVNGVELDIDHTIFENMNNVRFRKVYNGMESSYYVRKMKRIDVNNVERYGLAFAETIYNDDIAQFTFTDTINLKDKTDNLGRPLSELFITIVKTNYGTNLWYKTNNAETHSENHQLTQTELSEIEFSHCFGPVTCGYVLSHEKTDILDSNTMKDRESLRDIRLINNNQKFDSRMPQVEIKKDANVFDGDVVEFSPEDCMEHVLADCAFRFNTYQRENPTADYFIVHNLKTDDYDVPQSTAGNAEFGIESTSNEVNSPRDEGYYYKAHYPIKIRGFGGISQNGHNGIKVVNATPVTAENILIEIKSTLPTKLNNGDTVYVCDDKNGFMFEFVCTQVLSSTSFRMMPKVPYCKMNGENTECTKIEDPWAYFKDTIIKEKYDGNPEINWINLSQLLKTGQLKLRGKNSGIPDYAFKIGNNTYMWRNVLPYGEITDDEVPDYTFANNAFYLTPTIRFYLKRQDPDNTVGLYAKDIFPNDIYGNIKQPSNYYYEEEIDNGC